MPYSMILPESRSDLIEKLRAVGITAHIPAYYSSEVEKESRNKFIEYRLKNKQGQSVYGKVFLFRPPTSEGGPEDPVSDEYIISALQEVLRRYDVS